MRCVLDEGVPRKIARELRDRKCDVHEFPKSWKGLKNGDLLVELERGGFECLITCDKNIEWQLGSHQQSTSLLILPYQKLVHLQLILDDLAEAIRNGQLGRIIRVKSKKPSGPI